MSIEFNHAGIVVADIEAATRFYRDLLGFDVSTSYKMPGDWPITYLRSGGARLKEAGVQFKSGPKPAGSGIGRLMFVYDPDYNEVEIIQRDVDW